MNQDKLKEVINNIVNSIDVSNLELYRSELGSGINIFELFFDHTLEKWKAFHVHMINQYMLVKR